MEFKIKEVKVYDLDGHLLPYNLSSTIGNLIYGKAATIEWDSIARAIHSGKPVEITGDQLDHLQSLLQSDETPLVLPVKNALKEYCKTLKNQENVKDSKQKNESTAVAGE